MSFAAKYPGKCTKCAKPITVGTMIDWDRLSKTARHVRCDDPLAPQREAAIAIDASRASCPEQAPEAVRSLALSIPAPAGLEYLPYQRIGIAIACQRLGIDTSHLKAHDGSREDGDAKRRVPENSEPAPRRSSEPCYGTTSEIEGSGGSDSIGSRGGGERGVEGTGVGRNKGGDASSGRPIQASCGSGPDTLQLQGRERSDAYAIRGDGESVPIAAWLHQGAPDQDQRPWNGASRTDSVQGGLREPTDTNSGGDGRSVPQVDATAREGRQENVRAGSSRVDGSQDTPRGVLIADEPGLGKTCQVAGIINVAGDYIRTVLVVCPSSLRIWWQRELTRWSVRLITVTILSGIKSSADAVRLALDGDGVRVLVINYDIAHAWAPILRGIVFDLLCCDEAHYLKTPDSRRTKAIVGTEPKGRGEARKPGEPGLQAKRRVLLTGTPIVNRPVEAWPLVHFLDPTTWPKKWTYLTRYCGAVQSRWGWDFTGATNLAELQNKLRSTIMTRRLKADVLTELPAKRRQVVVVPANGASGVVDAESRAWACHEETLERLRADVELSKASADPADYQAAVDRLQAAAKAAFSEISKLRHDTAVAKIPYVVQHAIDSLEGGSAKVVIFAWHHDVVNGLMAGLSEYGPVDLTGETPMLTRQANVDRFQSDPSVRVFVGSIAAAGVGITLTAASHVIFAELDWVPGNVTQAEDRCHRIGQTDSVLVQHLVLDGSLDSRMAKVLVEKQDVLDRALDRVTEVAMDPTVPAIPGGKPASDSATRKQIEEVAATLTPAQVQAIHQGLRIVAGMDFDGARLRNDMGFSKIDSMIGRKLAEVASLTPLQAALGLRLVNKYRRQLGPDLLARAKGEVAA